MASTRTLRYLIATGASVLLQERCVHTVTNLLRKTPSDVVLVIDTTVSPAARSKNQLCPDDRRRDVTAVC